MSAPLGLPLAVALAALAGEPGCAPGSCSRSVAEAVETAVTVTITKATALQAWLGRNDGAWLDAVRLSGSEAGLGDLARRVFITGSGKLYVPVAAERARIIAARTDAATVAEIARAELMRREQAMETGAAVKKAGRGDVAADIPAPAVGSPPAWTAMGLGLAALRLPRSLRSAGEPTAVTARPRTAGGAAAGWVTKIVARQAPGRMAATSVAGTGSLGGAPRTAAGTQ
jgi:hypothetical protein